MNYTTKLEKLHDRLYRYENFEDGELDEITQEIEDIEESFTDDTTVEEERLHRECEDLIGQADQYWAAEDAECERECIRDEMAYEGMRHFS